MKVGDKVVVLYNYRQWSESVIIEILQAHNEKQGEITKVARKYITVMSNGIERKFAKPEGINKNGYYWMTNEGTYRMYMSVDDVEKQLEYERLRRGIHELYTVIERLPYDKLLAIRDIALGEE